MMKNAKVAGRADLHQQAFVRLCEVESRQAGDSITVRLMQAVQALEEVRGTRAARTRAMLARHGAIHVIKAWLTYKVPTEGYEGLVKAGLWRLLGEAVALDFPDRFTEEDLKVARYRIDEAKQGRVAEPFLPQLFQFDL